MSACLDCGGSECICRLTGEVDRLKRLHADAVRRLLAMQAALRAVAITEDEDGPCYCDQYPHTMECAAVRAALEDR